MSFEPTPITCVQCNAKNSGGIDFLYDDRAEQYYCDDGCFRDWADENFEEVADFYRRMNVD